MHTLNCNGLLLDLSTPVVMGILNATTDSFFDGGQYLPFEAALERAHQVVAEGAAILDIGGASSRPGSEVVPEAVEHQRVVPLIQAVRAAYPQLVISVDTWRASVARAAVAAGANIINDISAGRMDGQMWATVADLRVPYVLMHMQGTPQDMQKAPHYEQVTTEVLDFFALQCHRLQQLGVNDIVIDPGFGFGKTIDHNYLLFKEMGNLPKLLSRPMLVGISRKSMLYKFLDTTPDAVLPVSAALHWAALDRGANILRVHDVKAAVDVVKVWQKVQDVI